MPADHAAVRALQMRAWFVGVLLLGCGKNGERPVPTPQVEAAAAGGCADRAGRLERELRQLAGTRPGFLPLVQGIDAPSVAGGQPIKDRGWVIAVARDGGTFIQGYRFENLEHVRSATDQFFKSALERVAMDGGSTRDLRVPLYIWADRDAPARVIAELVTYADPEGPWPKRAAGAKLDDRTVPADDPPPPEEEDPARLEAIEQARKAGILAKPSGPTAPRVPIRLLVGAGARPSPTDAKLPASEPESTSYVVAQLKAAIGSCPPIITTLGTASLEGLPSKEAEKLAKELPAGLESCECKLADLNAFEAGLRTWFGAWSPPLAWIAMPKLDHEDKRTLGQVLKP